MPTSKVALASSGPPHGPLAVKDWMTRSPHSVGREQPLGVAHRMMQAYGLRHLPVLDAGRLVGLLSDRDLYFLESIAGVDTEKETVEEGMSPEVYSVPPEARLETVVSDMATHKYGCAVVMDGPKVVGIFTTTDALELLARYLGRP